jgi:hypothetical protein
MPDERGVIAVLMVIGLKKDTKRHPVNPIKKLIHVLNKWEDLGENSFVAAVFAL